MDFMHDHSSAGVALNMIGDRVISDYSLSGIVWGYKYFIIGWGCPSILFV